MKGRKKKNTKKKKGLSGTATATASKSGKALKDMLAVVGGFTGSMLLGKGIDKFLPNAPEETSFLKKHKGTIAKLGLNAIGGGLLAFKAKSDTLKHMGYGVLANTVREAVPKTFLNGLFGLGEFDTADYYTEGRQLNAPEFNPELPMLEGGATLNLPASEEEDMAGMGQSSQEEII